MNRDYLPIGSIIKTKKDKLAVVIGYFFDSPAMNVYQKNVFKDYIVSPYPFSCSNTKNKNSLFNKYSFFDYNCSSINNDEIKEVIFEGYKDEEYNKMIEEFSK